MPQIKKILVHEGKSLSNSAILTYNVPSFDTIDDIYLRFTNSGAAAAETDIKSSIGKLPSTLTVNRLSILLSKEFTTFTNSWAMKSIRTARQTSYL